MTHDPKDRYEDFLAGIDRMKECAAGEEEYLNGITEHGGAPEPEDAPNIPIGRRVAAFREQQGLTLTDVASRTGYTEDHIARVEKGEVSPPLGELIRLGKALGMKMGFFLSGGEARSYSVIRAMDRQTIARRAASEDKVYGYTYQSLAPGKSNRHMEPFLITLEPTTETALSAHDGEEFIFVLEGRMEAMVDRDRILLEPGDAIYYDSSVPHLVRCVDGPFTRILAVLYTQD